MEKLTINIIRSVDSIVFFNRINSLNELFVKGAEIIFAHWDRVDFMKAPNVHFNFPNTLAIFLFRKTFSIYNLYKTLTYSFLLNLIFC